MLAHTISPPGGLPDLPAKQLNERLHQGGEGFNNHHTSHHDDHQPMDPTNHSRRDGEPEVRGHVLDPEGPPRRCDLAIALEQHRPDP
jgi:hypothetical protein